MKHDIDNKIIRGLRQSDEDALTELYNTYWGTLFISSYNLLKNREICEDIIQDVFLGIWRSRETLNIKVSLKSYLYACTRYQAFKHLRRNQVKIRVDFHEELDRRFQFGSPEIKLMHEELVGQVNTLVDNLPEKCRKVYKLSREEQLSHREISSLMNISTKTVENHITKALRILKMGIGGLMSLLFL